MGKGKAYDAEQDYKMKVQEFRAEWEAAMALRAEESETVYGKDDIDDSLLHGSMHTYFERTSPVIRGMQKNVVEPLSLPDAADEKQEPMSHE